MIEFLLGIGVLVAVPLGLRLVDQPFLRDPRVRLARSIAATMAVLTLLFEPSLEIGVLAVPWAAFTGYVALRSLLKGLSLQTIACGYLAFGAGWLVLAAADIQPLDFSPQIVILTAVHFHFTGFGALLIADAATSAMPRLGKLPAFGVALAMPLVAIGFTLSTTVGFVGVVLLVVSLISVAGLTLIDGPGSAGRAERLTLRIGSAAVLVGMALALHYGAGTYLGFATLSIDRMAATHGIANTIFVVTGLFGWSFLRGRGPRPEPSNASG